MGLLERLRGLLSPGTTYSTLHADNINLRRKRGDDDEERFLPEEFGDFEPGFRPRFTIPPIVRTLGLFIGTLALVVFVLSSAGRGSASPGPAIPFEDDEVENVEEPATTKTVQASAIIPTTTIQEDKLTLTPVPTTDIWPFLVGKRDKTATRVPPAIPRKLCPAIPFDDYSKRHAEIIAGNFASLEKLPIEQRRPRFLVYTCRPHIVGEADPCGGLADRLVGIVTSLMFAMLSGRVFLIDFQRSIKATDVFLPVSIDWGVSLPQFVNTHGLNVTGDYRELFVDLHNPKNHTVAQYTKEKWDDWWHEEVVRVQTNRGLSYLMFNNPQYGQTMRSWGLKPETAFACFLEYLLTPVPRIAERVNALIPSILDPAFTTIGLQIRTGDLKAFGKFGDTNNVTTAKGFFTCVEKIADRTWPKRPMRLFLVSDSMNLKKDAKRVYKDSVIITDAVPKHLGITNELEAFTEFPFGKGNHKPTQEDLDRLAALKQAGKNNKTSQLNETEAYEGAIMELWTLTFAPYKVISIRSGFGSVAVMRRYWLKPNTAVRGGDGWIGTACGFPARWVNYTQLATEWSGG